MWPNLQETADLVIFLKKSLMENFFGKFLCSAFTSIFGEKAIAIFQKYYVLQTRKILTCKVFTCCENYVRIATKG